MNPILKIKRSFKKNIGKPIFLIGRISSVRSMKLHFFADLFDSGHFIQLYLSDINVSNLPSTGDLVKIEGTGFLTKTNEPSIKVTKIDFINKWRSKQGYKTIKSESKSTPLKSFIPEAYYKCSIPFAVRNHIRDFFRSQDFLEVQTPVLCRLYNGGRSFPVTTQYLNHELGYNRGTMEERMQALVGIGFNKIFQIGSIFRSSNETTFLEGYAAYMDWETGQDLIRELCKYVCKKMQKDGFVSDKPYLNDLIDNNWNIVNYFDEAISYFGKDIQKLLHDGNGLPEYLKKQGLNKKKEVYLENVADIIANAFIAKQKLPTIVNNFPSWSSPLYRSDERDTKYSSLQRSRVYIPGQIGGFDIGVQENDYGQFIKRIEEQHKQWLLKPNDQRAGDSELQRVISAGLPPMFGLGINPDRLSKIWGEDISIDPFE